MENVANDVVSFTNYRDVGFSIDNGHQDGAINSPWSLWHPKLRAQLTMDFGNLICLLFIGSWLCLVGEGDIQGIKSMNMFVFSMLSLVCFLLWIIILLILVVLLWLQVIGWRGGVWLIA